MISSQEIDGRRRARSLAEAYLPSKHDAPSLPPETNSVWESISLGKNLVARRVGARVLAGSVILALTWLVASSRLSMSFVNRIAGVAVLVYFAAVVRDFCCGKPVYIHASVPAQPGRTGLRWFAGVMAVLMMCLALYLMIHTLTQ
jgi:hypothetical protein